MERGVALGSRLSLDSLLTEKDIMLNLVMQAVGEMISMMDTFILGYSSTSRRVYLSFLSSPLSLSLTVFRSGVVANTLHSTRRHTQARTLTFTQANIETEWERRDKEQTERERGKRKRAERKKREYICVSVRGRETDCSSSHISTSLPMLPIICLPLP